jgi:hypothetical protein
MPRATPEQYKLIQQNCLLDESIPIENVYVFKRRACDNLLDRHMQVLSHKALQTMAATMKDNAALISHWGYYGAPWGRIFDSKTVIDKSQGKGYNQEPDAPPYEYCEALEYTVLTDENKSFITLMDAGIDYKVSVGFSYTLDDLMCSICGEPILCRDSDGNFLCPHMPGREYDEGMCYMIFDDIKENLELSNVAIPAQPRAGSLKAFDGSQQQNMGSDQKNIGSKKILTANEALNKKVVIENKDFYEIQDSLFEIKEKSMTAKPVGENNGMQETKTEAEKKLEAEQAAKDLADKEAKDLEEKNKKDKLLQEKKEEEEAAKKDAKELKESVEALQKKMEEMSTEITKGSATAESFKAITDRVEAAEKALEALQKALNEQSTELKLLTVAKEKGTPAHAIVSEGLKLTESAQENLINFTLDLDGE